jgi:hypothetical protein
MLQKLAVGALALSLSLPCGAQSPTATPDTTKSDPIAYLNRALDEMQAPRPTQRNGKLAPSSR